MSETVDEFELTEIERLKLENITLRRSAMEAEMRQLVMSHNAILQAAADRVGVDAKEFVFSVETGKGKRA